ncbi:palmitoyl-protein thioesterase [Rhodotorula toruloides]|uniref:Palmitoyl-protein thioesterase n=1 Tax=Rhodotorula toruloides TaxID=5286 RepID=A0A511KNZ9_RHOTO|nr:palmitoyl-protein thioesterase [Rhodotorula toruloides]
MRPKFASAAAAAVLAALPASFALPTFSPSSQLLLRPSVPPVPIVIWHGLGDRYDAPGLQSLKADLEAAEGLEGVFVHIVQVGADGPADQKATFFGSANAHVAQICAQLASLPEITDPASNPSRMFDALGFSQGGQLLRAVIERCNGERLGSVKARNLVTVGSQHMGISALPPCPPGSSPFSPCRLMHLSLVRSSIYSRWAQQNIVPAQYFRDPERIDEYLGANEFLRDINNEREGDRQVEDGESAELVEVEPRNQTYKENLSSLNRFVMFRFSKEQTVVPPHSSHFTLPSPSASNCPRPPLPLDLSCYPTPLPYSDLPLYAEDYIGLQKLDKRGAVVLDVCEGPHMDIDEECWRKITRWFGERGWKGEEGV